MQRISQSMAMTTVVALGLCASTALAQEKVHKVGYIADLSGPMQDNYAPIYEAFDYYVKELNARGGIDGVPVRLFVRDDQLDATRAASVALELITSEGVGSLWGMSQSRTHLAVYQTAQRNRVPAVSMFSGIKEILPPKPLPYAFSAGHVFEVAGEVSGKLAAQLVKGQGKAICNSIESPGGVAACQYTEGAAQAGQLQTGTVLFPPTVTEFGAIAQRIVGMQPTIVVAHAGSGQNVGLIRALRGAGYDGPILMGSHGLNEAPLINALQGVGALGQASDRQPVRVTGCRGQGTRRGPGRCTEIRQEDSDLDHHGHGLVARQGDGSGDYASAAIPVPATSSTACWRP